MDTPNLAGLAVSEPGHAANGFEAIAILAGDNHRKTSMMPGQVDMLRDITFRAPALIQFTDSTIVHARSDTLQDTSSDAESHQHESTATSEPVNDPAGVSTLPLERTHNLCAVRTHSLSSFDKSPDHPQPMALRHQDGPPKSSEINATTVSKVRRISTDDNERDVGCFSFFRSGSRRRAGPERMTMVTANGAIEHSGVEHRSGAFNEGTQEPTKTSLDKGAKLEVPGQTGAEGYRRSSSLPERAKREPATAVDTVSGDWRPLEHADLATFASSRAFDHSPRGPYDMRYGAVQPQYFNTAETSIYRQVAPTELQRQYSTQRRTSGGSTGPSPSYVRSGTTLSTSSSTTRKPLVDLTPQYQPPPQHRHKGHGYLPERLGSGKLIEYATSPKNESSTPFALD
jgi:hypothetical protein